jgi:hypothetical protein
MYHVIYIVLQMIALDLHDCIPIKINGISFFMFLKFLLYVEKQLNNIYANIVHYCDRQSMPLIMK